jgi:hypothetical protein
MLQYAALQLLTELLPMMSLFFDQRLYHFLITS